MLHCQALLEQHNAKKKRKKKVEHIRKTQLEGKCRSCEMSQRIMPGRIYTAICENKMLEGLKVYIVT